MKIIPIEKNESIHIGNEIEITVLRILPSGEVQLGIKAPEKTLIHREEYINQIKKLKQQLESLNLQDENK